LKKFFFYLRFIGFFFFIAIAVAVWFFIFDDLGGRPLFEP